MPVFKEGMEMDEEPRTGKADPGKAPPRPRQGVGPLWSRLDRYIWSEWLKVFLLCLAATLGLILLSEIQDDFPDLRSLGASSETMARIFLNRFPAYIPIVLPVSILLSILFVLGNLHRNNEIIAMRNAGLSLWRITRSLWWTGLLLTVGLFYLNGAIIPTGLEQARRMWSDLELARALESDADAEVVEVGTEHNLTFRNPDAGRIWFINRYSRYARTGYGISISELDARGRETRRILASSGRYDTAEGAWLLQDGRDIRFRVETRTVLQGLLFEELHYAITVEDPELMLAIEKRPKDLTFLQLRRILTTLSPERYPGLEAYALQYYKVAFNPLVCLFVVGIAIPFAVSGVRTNPLVGVSKSLGLFAAYYFVSNLVSIVAPGQFDPLLAALIPNILMISLALWFYLKAVRPS